MENKKVIICEIDYCKDEATMTSIYRPTININGRTQTDYSATAQKLNVCSHHSWVLAMS